MDCILENPLPDDEGVVEGHGQREPAPRVVPGHVVPLVLLFVEILGFEDLQDPLHSDLVIL